DEQQQKYICFSINVFLMTAMSATPGQNETSIQKLINNLKISRLEVRSENDLDIKKYRHETKEEIIKVPLPNDLLAIREKLVELIEKRLHILSRQKAFPWKSPSTITPYAINSCMKDFQKRAGQYNQAL
ncbi:hypothetical protein RFI_33419, partial [Reticulomyxa filosa]